MNSKTKLSKSMLRYILIIMIISFHNSKNLISDSKNKLILKYLLKGNGTSFSFLSTLFLGSVGAGVLLIILIVVIICICKAKSKDENEVVISEKAEPVVEVKLLLDQNDNKSSKFFNKKKL